MLLSIPNAVSDIRKVVRARGRPILDSGNYRHGFAVTERKKVEPGTYVIAVSTFNPGKVGVFSVKVASSIPVSLLRIP